MNNEQLRNLQALLRNRINSYHHDIKEGSEIENSTLAAMQMSQDMGESKQARELLDLLPEPESDVVLDYRALRRVHDMDFEPSPVSMGKAPDRYINEKMREVRDAALDVVVERIGVRDMDDGHMLLEDPITKSQFQVCRPEHDDAEAWYERQKRRFARDIIDMGVA